MMPAKFMYDNEKENNTHEIRMQELKNERARLLKGD
jgi:hypothetical protein